MALDVSISKRKDKHSEYFQKLSIDSDVHSYLFDENKELVLNLSQFSKLNDYYKDVEFRRLSRKKPPEHFKI